MSDSQKWAWWTLGVVALTVAAYGAFLSVRGHDPATAAVLSLMALTALPASSRRYFQRRNFDERERQIANKALRAGFSGFWLVFIALMLGAGIILGWDATLSVPVWTLGEAVWCAAVVVLGVQAATTIVLYRSPSLA